MNNYSELEKFIKEGRRINRGLSTIQHNKINGTRDDNLFLMNRLQQPSLSNIETTSKLFDSHFHQAKNAGKSLTSLKKKSKNALALENILMKRAEKKFPGNLESMKNSEDQKHLKMYNQIFGERDN